MARTTLHDKSLAPSALVRRLWMGQVKHDAWGVVEVLRIRVEPENRSRRTPAARHAVTMFRLAVSVTLAPRGAGALAAALLGGKRL
jgi:hypothetical protein